MTFGEGTLAPSTTAVAIMGASEIDRIAVDQIRQLYSLL
jgi:hypothetical protein